MNSKKLKYNLYKLTCWFNATGVKGKPNDYSEKIIEASSKDEAYYLYHKDNGADFGSFEDFMKQPQDVREWATECEPILKVNTDYKDLQDIIFTDVPVPGILDWRTYVPNEFKKVWVHLSHMNRYIVKMMAESQAKIDPTKVSNIEVDGIDTADAPEFCDAYICSADYNGVEMTEEELEKLNDEDSLLHDAVYQSLHLKY